MSSSDLLDIVESVLKLCNDHKNNKTNIKLLKAADLALDIYISSFKCTIYELGKPTANNLGMRNLYNRTISDAEKRKASIAKRINVMQKVPIPYKK